MSTEGPPGVLPRCALHPDALAGATCQRCGGFVCTACTTWVMGRMYCPPCAARPEVNYLETFRLRLWGRRDAGAWMVGAGSVLLIGLAVLALLVAGDIVTGAALLASAGVGLAYFVGKRWARPALLAVPLGALLLTARALGPPALLFFFPFTLAVSLFRDTRSRLFFRLDVPERELRRLWDRRVNNPLARHALSLGVGAMFLPVFAPLLFIFGALSVLTLGFVLMGVLAVVLGVVALQRVDLEAQPPIGRRWEALGGLCLGLASLALWGLLYGPRMLELLGGWRD